MNRDFILTRAAGLARLADVIPQVGIAYASGRNSDLGPSREPTITALSPYLRRRLILEEEVIAAAVAAHGPERAGKFVEGVFWRSCVKGHLKTHPAI